MPCSHCPRGCRAFQLTSMNRECFTPAPPAEAVQDKNRNSRLLFQLLAFTHLFQHTVRIHPKFVFKAWLNMANMPIYFWRKSFRADNPSFQYNIKMPVLPFTYNKKYTIQPQEFFSSVWTQEGVQFWEILTPRERQWLIFFFSLKKFLLPTSKKDTWEAHCWPEGHAETWLLKQLPYVSF